MKKFYKYSDNIAFSRLCFYWKVSKISLKTYARKSLFVFLCFSFISPFGVPPALANYTRDRLRKHNQPQERNGSRLLRLSRRRLWEAYVRDATVPRVAHRRKIKHLPLLSPKFVPRDRYFRYFCGAKLNLGTRARDFDDLSFYLLPYCQSFLLIKLCIKLIKSNSFILLHKRRIQDHNKIAMRWNSNK